MERERCVIFVFEKRIAEVEWPVSSVIVGHGSLRGIVKKIFFPKYMRNTQKERNELAIYIYAIDCRSTNGMCEHGC